MLTSAATLEISLEAPHKNSIQPGSTIAGYPTTGIPACPYLLLGCSQKPGNGGSLDAQ